jgi:ABC-2 type transport system permease protein
MEIAATYNPVTYIMESMRSLILDDWSSGPILRGFAVVVVAAAVMLTLNVRVIRKFD